MTQKARFGLVLSNRAVVMSGSDAQQLLALAEVAEGSGAFEHVWVGDSILAKPRVESLTLLAAIAARTRRVRLGVACMASLPSRDPVLLAHQWASLDVLSRGRTILAACIGGSGADPKQRGEYRNLGIAAGERARRLEEGIEILRRLWSEERVRFAGEFHRLEDATLEPRPVQKPPPIWIVASPRPGAQRPEIVERSLRRAARLGDGWLTNAHPVSEFAELRRRVLGYAREHGRGGDPLPCALYTNVHLDADPERALRESQAWLDAYYSMRSTRDAVETAVALGPAERCVERLRGFVAAGATDVLLRFTARDPAEQLRRCLREVMPFV